MAGEIEAAAERRENGDRGYWESKQCEAYRVALADWAMVRIAADRAEREERARPIDAEWLESIGFTPDGVLELGGTGRLTWRPSHGDVMLWGYPGTACSTRGRLLDLLIALKGGAR